ncbi:DUF1772 domain-containing protein [Enhydrobacter sp.]|jgi:hypothetical protein|uniref:DUF1772 domain-containing protein n=1 Tax=Enhydrobacter sp. TaxID=1894999 RepID=UPI002625CED4|nr:DUF1772 domain-containing protein [Enhydrobacter sp.]
MRLPAPPRQWPRGPGRGQIRDLSRQGQDGAEDGENGQVVAEGIALGATGMFAGLALQVSLAEQPARLALLARARLQHWQASAGRAQTLALPFALAGCAGGLAAWAQSGGPLWLAGALLVGATVPVSLLMIAPTARRLRALDPREAGPTSNALIARWGRRHAARTALAVGAEALLALATFA